MAYTFYIDESGDAGIETVRTENQGGASPYMTMGGVLVKNSTISEVEENLLTLKNEISMRSDLHCRQLCHERKVRFSDFLNTQPVLCFGVISLKETLGSYRKTINNSSHAYYNKCAQYLLERLGLYLENTPNITADDVEVVFEHGNFDYQKLKNLIATCQRTPRHRNTSYLRNINIDNIISKVKNEAPLLQLSDLVAHALYKTVDGGIIGVTETRYLDIIKSKFYSKDGRIIENGLYPVHSISQLDLPQLTVNFYRQLAA